MPPDTQRIIWEGKQLEYNRAIEQYNISREDYLHVVLRLI